MSIFCINSPSDLPTPEILWNAVKAVQGGCRERLLSYQDVEDFLVLCHGALALARRYDLDKDRIEVLSHGGGVTVPYKYKANSTAMIFNGQRILVGRITARKSRPGEINHYCRIDFYFSKLGTRQALQRDGWSKKGDRYARVTLANAYHLGVAPSPFAAVLGGQGGQSPQPQPHDAVLGGQSRQIGPKPADAVFSKWE